ncbi:MAG: ribosome-associated translation inhibitor RaiA [Bacteroidota bacterium]|nr:ribosome-associated translation inhibitor RaiA [Bacteroidota bacterium]MDX5431322.1 ribosome-associated translation inhibitor RaiA [Bacteroidota bacterium]MDX5470060.1 ribosome-associated translation inhibitor RaiA [Bacteroidota bacterium]
MEINIQSINFTADQKLIEYIEKRLKKLTTFYDGIVDANVYLKVENVSNNNNKLLEVKLNVFHQTLFCSEQCRTFECAIDLAFESLKVQLKKYKEKSLAV